MIISFELPGDLGSVIRDADVDLGERAREALLVELYRDQKITHHQLGRALELSDYETDGLLRRYGVDDGPSLEEFERQREFLEARRCP